MEIHTYKDLIVWQRSIELVIEIYELTEGFPPNELYGLTSQIRRAAVSISSNIAEGRMRGSRKDYRKFLFNAYGSGAELETQLEIARRLSKMKDLDYLKIDSLLNEVMKMLNSMINRLRAS